MTPETAAAIARRIGMTPAPHRSIDGGAAWWDGNDSVAESRLASYLATGDRPLRVLMAYDIDLLRVNTMWRATGRREAGFYLRSEKRDTPATAILACAAALEEGDE